MLFCKICEIFNNACFYRTHRRNVLNGSKVKHSIELYIDCSRYIKCLRTFIKNICYKSPNLSGRCPLFGLISISRADEKKPHAFCVQFKIMFYSFHGFLLKCVRYKLSPNSSYWKCKNQLNVSLIIFLYSYEPIQIPIHAVSGTQNVLSNTFDFSFNFFCIFSYRTKYPTIII